MKNHDTTQFGRKKIHQTNPIGKRKDSLTVLKYQDACWERTRQVFTAIQMTSSFPV